MSERILSGEPTGRPNGGDVKRTHVAERSDDAPSVPPRKFTGFPSAERTELSAARIGRKQGVEAG